MASATWWPAGSRPGEPAGGGHASGLVLAMLIGMNVGPNLTHAGSLATLLGALTVPAGLVAG